MVGKRKGERSQKKVEARSPMRTGRDEMTDWQSCSWVQSDRVDSAAAIGSNRTPESFQELLGEFQISD